MIAHDKSNRKKMSNKLFAGIWGSVLAVLLAVLVAANALLLQYSNLITRVMNHTDTITMKRTEADPDAEVIEEDNIYFKSDFATEEELVAYQTKVSQDIEAEGIVLMQNNNQLLPIAKGTKISIFGQACTQFRYGGGGSGAIDESGLMNLKDAFTQEGFEVNNTLWDMYSSSGLKIPKEVAPKDFSNAVTKSLESFGDVAVFVFSRPAHEATDLTEKEVSLTDGERAVLDYVNANFDNIVVLLNIANAVELGWINEYNHIQSVLWVGYPGQQGMISIPRVVNGAVNPSGRLVDTYAYSAESSPAFENFGYGRVENGYNPVGAKNTYVVYAEGIYVGYRYYETRYEDTVLGQGNADSKKGSIDKKAWDYGKEVMYPFGYGLSYTTFDYAGFSMTEEADRFIISVDVTNSGSTAGKEVVQVYFQSPYTDYDRQHLVEKASVELCGFAKTDLLAPGASETVRIEVPKEELRAYDRMNARTYIVDAGTYYFTVADNAHAAVNNILAAKGFTTADGMDAEGSTVMVSTYEQAELDSTTYAVSADTGVEITNQFDYSSLTYYYEDYTYLTRNDWDATWPSFYGETEKKGKNINHYTTFSDQLLADSQENRYHEEPDAVMPVTASGEGLNLISMRGKSFDDPEWEKILDCVTVDEMTNLVRIGGWQTAQILSIAKPASSDQDGPAGISNELIMSNLSTMGYPIGVVLASTWNEELIEEMGKCVGEDGLKVGVHGWYAPGAGTHRTPYGGRNFEYYSEDGFISGKITAAEIRGAQSKGMYVYLKHLVLNDQEDRRYGIATFCEEQALRELYMTPFEMAVREADAHGMMAAFCSIGGVWCGANEDLLQDVLRGEWGFHGIVVTDYATANDGYMWIDMGLQNGSDLWLNSDVSKYPLDNAGDSATMVNALRRATKNILYTVVNSSAMNGISSDTVVVKVMPLWQKWMIAVDVSAGVILLAGIFLIVRRCKKNRPAAILVVENTEG